MHPDQSFTNLHRLLAAKDFNNEAELQQFLDTLVGQKLTDLPQADLSPAEQALDMVYQAADLPPAEARMTIELALMIDTDCIAAFEALGDLEDSVAVANAFYEKGIALGRAQFADNHLAEDRGHFWGIHETRPFMRCMSESADCLYEMGKTAQAIALYKEMLELNPNDNQGVRDLLMLYLIGANEFESYREYAAKYDDDILAFPAFNKALAAFKETGESEAATGALGTALAQNKHVAKRLLARKPVLEQPSLYGIGSEQEADMYTYYAWKIWQETPGAIDWLKKHAKKPGTAKKKK